LAWNVSRVRNGVRRNCRFGVIRVAQRSRECHVGLLASLRRSPVLYFRHAPLRLAAGRGTHWFFAFCTVWAGLGVALSQPPISYSSERIGVYAFAGLLGIVATRVAGAWTDRVGARKVLLVGLVVALAAALILGACLSNAALTLVRMAHNDRYRRRRHRARHDRHRHRSRERPVIRLSPCPIQY
jgi:hypothetical protein